jgi:hypothetical protein
LTESDYVFEKAALESVKSADPYFIQQNQQEFWNGETKETTMG